MYCAKYFIYYPQNVANIYSYKFAVSITFFQVQFVFSILSDIIECCFLMC